MTTATGEPRSSAPHCGRCGRSVEEHPPARVRFRPPAALHWLARYAAPSVTVLVDPATTTECPGYETPYHDKENRWLQRMGVLTRRSRRA